jgi:chromosome segregation ATPase
MKKLLIVVLVLVLVVGAVGVLGYSRGWFSVTRDGNVDVQVDRTKFTQDRAAFSKTVGEKAKALKDRVANLWNQSEGLTGDEKVQAQKELGELKTKHDRLEEQIKDLDEAGQDRFESIKQDLSKSLEEVEKKIEELTKKLGKGKDK